MVLLQCLRCIDFVAMIFLQWFCCNGFFIVPCTYIYQRSYHLFWEKAISENIGPSLRVSKPMKVHHQLDEFFNNSCRATILIIKLVMIITHEILNIVPLSYHMIKVFGLPKLILFIKRFLLSADYPDIKNLFTERKSKA